MQCFLLIYSLTSSQKQGQFLKTHVMRTAQMNKKDKTILLSDQVGQVKIRFYLERNNMTLTSLLEAWMARLGQQHGLHVPRGFHLDGEVLSDVSAPE